MVLPEGVKKIVVYVDPSEQRMVEAICRELGVRSRSGCIRRVIREYYERLLRRRLPE